MTVRVLRAGVTLAERRRAPARLVIVGESNPDGHAPLSGETGHRVAELLGLEWRDYQALGRRNLYTLDPPTWSAPAARDQAWAIRAAYGRDQPTYLLLGRRVAAAFGYPAAAWCSMPAAGVAVLPHPSGRNRWYNVPGHRELAATFARGVLRYARDDDD